MHLDLGFCDHFCDQMITLIAKAIGNCPLEGKHLLFNPLQDTICEICQSSPIDKFVLPRASDILSFSDQHHKFQVQNVPVTLLDKIQLICISHQIYTYFLPTIP